MRDPLPFPYTPFYMAMFPRFAGCDKRRCPTCVEPSSHVLEKRGAVGRLTMKGDLTGRVSRYLAYIRVFPSREQNTASLDLLLR